MPGVELTLYFVSPCQFLYRVSLSLYVCVCVFNDVISSMWWLLMFCLPTDFLGVRNASSPRSLLLIVRFPPFALRCLFCLCRPFFFS